ncbi:MAG TPA: hypothetical protein VFF13_01235 [archaeon]|nr:hypothetical protein [archaeon]
MKTYILILFFLFLLGCIGQQEPTDDQPEISQLELGKPTVISVGIGKSYQTSNGEFLIETGEIKDSRCEAENCVWDGELAVPLVIYPIKNPDKGGSAVELGLTSRPQTKKFQTMFILLGINPQEKTATILVQKDVFSSGETGWFYNDPYVGSYNEWTYSPFSPEEEVITEWLLNEHNVEIEDYESMQVLEKTCLGPACPRGDRILVKVKRGDFSKMDELGWIALPE